MSVEKEMKSVVLAFFSVHSAHTEIDINRLRVECTGLSWFVVCSARHSCFRFVQLNGETKMHSLGYSKFIAVE